MNKLERIGLRIDKETKDILKQDAKNNDLSISHYLRRLINYARKNEIKP
jgi:hypothetical protein